MILRSSLGGEYFHVRSGHPAAVKLTFLRTLVGSGLKAKTETRRRLADLIPKHIAHIPESVQIFHPESSTITTTTGRSISYDMLVVAAGLQINWNGIEGLSQALVDSSSGVSSIYSYDTCDKAWADIEALRSGNAIFTQPAGVIKCAGGTFIRHIAQRYVET